MQLEEIKKKKQQLYQIAAKHGISRIYVFGFVARGESKDVSDIDLGAFQERHYTIPWSSMIGTRNIIVHGYDQVKLQIVWNILQHDLESLNSEITKVLE